MLSYPVSPLQAPLSPHLTSSANLSFKTQFKYNIPQPETGDRAGKPQLRHPASSQGGVGPAQLITPSPLLPNSPLPPRGSSVSEQDYPRVALHPEAGGVDSLLRTCGGSEPLQVPCSPHLHCQAVRCWATLPSLLCPLPADAIADLVALRPQAQAFQCFCGVRFLGPYPEFLICL